MTREQLKKHWKVIKAFKNGKEIQGKEFKCGDYPFYEWKDNINPKFKTDDEYRIKPEKDFIVGRWYKALLCNRIYYIKFKSRVGETISGEDICVSYSTNALWSNETLIKEALQNGPMTDLTEIQEYLPDGHVDKIYKYIKINKQGNEFIIVADHLPGHAAGNNLFGANAGLNDTLKTNKIKNK